MNKVFNILIIFILLSQYRRLSAFPRTPQLVVCLFGPHENEGRTKGTLAQKPNLEHRTPPEKLRNKSRNFLLHFVLVLLVVAQLLVVAWLYLVNFGFCLKLISSDGFLIMNRSTTSQNSLRRRTSYYFCLYITIICLGLHLGNFPVS